MTPEMIEYLERAISEQLDIEESGFYKVALRALELAIADQRSRLAESVASHRFLKRSIEGPICNGFNTHPENKAVGRIMGRIYANVLERFELILKKDNSEVLTPTDKRYLESCFNMAINSERQVSWTGETWPVVLKIYENITSNFQLVKRHPVESKQIYLPPDSSKTIPRQ